MARAKRTSARAEARRRYRATLDDPTLEPFDDDETAEAVAAAPATASARPARGASSAAAPRPSLGHAFRASFRPLDLRGDLRALPDLVLRTKAVWLPAALTFAAAALFVAFPANAITALLFNYFVYIPPVASIFLAGFLAPRASWLTGGIAGLIGAVAFSIAIQRSLGTPGATGEAITREVIDAFVVQSFVISPLSGIFFGGAAGWYRRFLNLANPNRGARPTSGKPPARKNDRRPLVARRR